MRIRFRKYHALGNDFLVVDRSDEALSRRKLSRLAVDICNRRTGVGADGLLYCSPSKKCDGLIDIYNADGGWAEKSGNGLRIAAVDRAMRFRRKKEFCFQTGSGMNRVYLGRRIQRGYQARTDLGEPCFEADKVPVRTRKRVLINSPLKFGGVNIPVTCLSVGNPHTVLLVDDFEFDWQALGIEIEWARQFPNGTNVEFVRLVNRHKIKVAEWERGAGATGSSGTGAAAAVCAMVMMGLVDRKCDVQFETGTLSVEWDSKSNLVYLSGPAVHVMEGSFEFK
ncbi:MAG: diaminopimelate epimerase [Candidatus Zixiibacteriota bacterium]|nr:MAG: diaminopimelate epimerase [candidate division Zixibacteria bacterium]